MTTFGYELEFTDGADRLIQNLTDNGYARQPPREGRGLHGYHCDCGACSDLMGTRFRAQRDSSCGGEVISGVFFSTDWDTATDCMHALQEAALDVDAVIDPRCGMHVHIGDADGEEVAEAGTLAMAWLGLEPLLWEHVAGAAWAQRRGTQNHLLSSAIVDRMQVSRVWERNSLYPVAERDLNAMPEPFKEEYVEAFRLELGRMSWDRHCDLARASHGGLYEMRIFNATRVAWRIELACRLSVALSHPDVAQVFADKTNWWLFEQRAQLGNRMTALRNGYRRQGRQYSGIDRPLQANLPISFEFFMETLGDFDERLVELISKQTGYVAARKAVGVERLRLPIGNGVDMSAWRHDEVLAVLNGTPAVEEPTAEPVTAF